MTTTNEFDVLIIGGGPAGATASIYAARNGLRVGVVYDGVFGGIVSSASLIENYPGFPDGVEGLELGERLRRHVENVGAVLINERVESIEENGRNGMFTLHGLDMLYAKAIILSMGVNYKHLNVPGESQLIGRGVSYCATCDGAFFRNRTVAVIGGGSSAFSSAEYLANIASKVYLIHRRNAFRAEKVLVDRVSQNGKIQLILNSVVSEVLGEKKVEGIVLKNLESGKETTLPVDGVFVQVGHVPNTQMVKDLVDLDENGYIKTDEEMKTSKKGLFAAGDIRHGALGQIVTAAADGAIAAQSVFEYINELGT
ncbi:thioredoxin-disulfide reductase [Coprothermobacter platensis]|uniref:thioredoxin-disulfide reductase n=1 Tax=Coprothermobacter platensis TaxID=108819 RepID=UPI00036D28F7|nr:thioredoxin-disulfide reductase [Coprothermobacter platensis]